MKRLPAFTTTLLLATLTLSGCTLFGNGKKAELIEYCTRLKVQHDKGEEGFFGSRGLYTPGEKEDPYYELASVFNQTLGVFEQEEHAEYVIKLVSWTVDSKDMKGMDYGKLVCANEHIGVFPAEIWDKFRVFSGMVPEDFATKLMETKEFKYPVDQFGLDEMLPTETIEKESKPQAPLAKEESETSIPLAIKETETPISLSGEESEFKIFGTCNSDDVGKIIGNSWYWYEMGRGGRGWVIGGSYKTSNQRIYFTDYGRNRGYLTTTVYILEKEDGTMVEKPYLPVSITKTVCE